MKSRLKYKAAVQYCAGLRLGGYSDWRTPTIDELDSVTSGYSYNKLEARGKKADSHPATGIELVWGKTPENGYIWSSTTHGNKMVTEDIDFGGHVDWSPTASYFSAGISEMICVRNSAGSKPTVQSEAQDAVLLSQAASRAGNYPAALDDANQAAALDPGSADALDALGVAEGHQGQWADAVAKIEAALKTNPKNAGYKADLKWAKKGLAASK